MISFGIFAPLDRVKMCACLHLTAAYHIFKFAEHISELNIKRIQTGIERDVAVESDNRIVQANGTRLALISARTSTQLIIRYAHNT